MPEGASHKQCSASYGQYRSCESLQTSEVLINLVPDAIAAKSLVHAIAAHGLDVFLEATGWITGERSVDVLLLGPIEVPRSTCLCHCLPIDLHFQPTSAGLAMLVGTRITKDAD